MENFRTLSYFLQFWIEHGLSIERRRKDLILFAPNIKMRLIVLDKHHQDIILRTFQELRPDYETNNIEFVMYEKSNNYWMLKNSKAPIYVDPYVLDEINANFIQTINRAYGEY